MSGMIQRAIDSILCWGMSVLLMSFFLLLKCYLPLAYSVIKYDLPLVVFGTLLLFLQRLSDLRGYALDKPPKPLVLLFECQDLHPLLYARCVPDLFFQSFILLRQIVDGGLVLFHLPQMLFQPGEVRPHHLQNLVPLFPGVQHPDFRHLVYTKQGACAVYPRGGKRG